VPFAGYKDFEDCVRKNQDKSDPDAFCGWLKSKVEGGNQLVIKYLKEKPEWLYGLFRLDLLSASLLQLNLLTTEEAKQALDGKKIWQGKEDAVVIDDHRWVHVWANSVKKGRNVFLNKKQLKRLHDLIVDEMQRREMDSGLNHKSPLEFSALALAGDNLTLFLEKRKEYMIDPAFISIIGSSVAGKENPDDLDLLVKTSKNELLNKAIRETLPAKAGKIDLVWDSLGPNGPSIPAYELWLKPSQNSMLQEPKYTVTPLSPIIPAQATREIDRKSAYSLFEDSYYIEPVSGIRVMIHRRENDLMAFSYDLEPVDIPKEIQDELLKLDDPRTFILDGFLSRENGQPIYYLIDMPWWRESEHTRQSAEVRKYFLSKLPELTYVKRNHAKYFDNREDTVSYLQEEEGPYVVIPGSSGYPIEGSSEWLLFAPDLEVWKLAESSDAEIKRLINDNEWESMSADKRFSLMTKRKTIEPLYPYAQLKTTKKGYSAREVFGLKSVEDLAKNLFKVPNKQANEVKIDGFRGQIHKKGDQVRIFTESGHDITEQLPTIVKDAKSLPAESFVFDAEITPYDEDFTNLGRAAAAPAFAKGAKGPVDDKFWVAHVFDILYLNGEDLHNLEYQDRRRRLRGVELPIRDHPDSKSDFKLHLWENNVYWATSDEQMIKLAEKVSNVPGSEGAMFKQADSKYRLSGNTPLWSKMKRSFEIDALVVGLNKDGSRYNYVGAIGPVEGVKDADAAPIDSPQGRNFVKYKGKTYSILGKTFNTQLKADIGSIIRVTVKETRKIDDKVYHWFHPKVLEVREDKTTPDPVKTAETIAESAKSQQKVKAGYLSSARYAEESPITCCQSPWVVINNEGNWIYLNNDETLVENLRELSVEKIYASGMDRDIADSLLENGIDFELTNHPTIAAFNGRPLYLETDFPPNQVSLSGEAFREFYKSIWSHRDPHMKLSCGGGIPLPELRVKKLAQDPYLSYPDESKTWKYVLQFHVRGLSVHGDFRSEISKQQLIGWTWDTGKSLIKPMLRRLSDEKLKEVGLTKAQIDDMEIKDVSSKLRSTKEGKALMKQLSEKTQDLSVDQLKILVNELWDETVKPIMENPNEKILTQKKAPEPHDWLTYKGEVPAGAVGATSELEGVFIIMDEGTIEYGAQKQWFHEYFIKGKRMKGKLVVRRLPTRKDWKLKQSFAWLTFFTKEGDMPYAISSRAVSQDWMPPKGVSALPKKVKTQIPKDRQYWRAKNAKEIRDQLVKEIKGKDITLKLAQGLKFSVKRVWHKGPEVRRGQPIVRYWLLLHSGDKVVDAWDFGRDSDPLESTGIQAIRRDINRLDVLLKTTGELPSEHPASQTKRLENEFDTSDSGKATVITDQNDMLRLKLDGGQLKGTYIFIKRDGNTWVFERAELPETKKTMLLQSATCDTGVCSTTGVMHLSTKDFKHEKVGNLLFISGPAIKPGEVVPMDGKPSYFTKEGIKKFWPSMIRQPIVVLHGDLKGDVIGFVDKIHYDEKTGWGWIDRGVIWHPLGMKLILEGKLPAFSIEVIPETIWDPVHQHDKVLDGVCVGLAVVPKGACVTCNHTEAVMGELDIALGEVYKFGMTLEEYLQEQYWSRGHSTQEIADMENMPRSTVEYYMKLSGVPRRDYLEARHLRSVKEGAVRKFGGRTTIVPLGTRAFTKIPQDNCVQCKEASAGGKSMRNYTSTAFNVGTETLIVNAPPGIAGMAGVYHLKPKYVLIEHMGEDALGGLHELKGLNPIVFASAETWSWLRDNYKSLGLKGDFDDVYGFPRYLIKADQPFNVNDIYEVTPIEVTKQENSALGFRIKLGDQVIWHCSDLLKIPDAKKALSDINIYIGDGSTDQGHASMEEQIKWAQSSDVEKIYFTQIGHLGKTHDELRQFVMDMAPNAEVMFDGMEISLGGNTAGAYFDSKAANELLDGKRKIIVRNKPYSEYSRQVILLLSDDTAHALIIEGFPEGPYPAEKVKSEMKDEHLMSDKEWKKAVGDSDKVWVYKPKVIKRFTPKRKFQPSKAAGPYIHDVKLIG